LKNAEIFRQDCQEGQALSRSWAILVVLGPCFFKILTERALEIS
jgi:hypothetical protein